MKKTASTFLIVIYAFTTTGFALKANYCCNNLKSVSLVLTEESKEKGGCCPLKLHSFKIKDTHAVVGTVAAPHPHFTVIHFLYDFFQVNTLANNWANREVIIRPPPLYASAPVYISNCVFRI